MAKEVILDLIINLLKRIRGVFLNKDLKIIEIWEDNNIVFFS